MDLQNADKGKKLQFDVDLQSEDVEVIMSPTRPYKPESPRTLDPNHPLLAKFQKALKEHLQRQIHNLSTEVQELEADTKKFNNDRDLLGIEVYDFQQTVTKQQNTMEQYMEELKSVSAAKEEMNQELELALESHKELTDKLNQAKKEENDVRVELESMNMLMTQMTKWTEEIESELTVNQRVFEKTKKDKIKLAEEKRQLDMVVYRLMSEIWRMENELETLDMQLRTKENEREQLGEKVAQSNIDIETFNSEYRCLIHSWNSIIVAITQRDKHYEAGKKQMEKMNEKLTGMTREIEQVKKLANKEMRGNERLTIMKCKIEDELASMKRSIDIDSNKKRNLEKQMDSSQNVFEQVEKDIQRVQMDITLKMNEFENMNKEFERMSAHKRDTAEKILLKMQEHLTNDKTTKYMGKYVQEIREKTRSAEVTLAMLENTYATTVMDLESQKNMNIETRKYLDELIAQQEVIQAEVKEYTDTANKYKYAISKKQRDIGLLNKKIETLVERIGSADLSPQELKIKYLEKTIEDTQEKNKELQRNWLRQQGHVVSLSQQRQDQIKKMDLLRKQTLILTQKNLKISDEFEAYNIQEQKVTNSINLFQKRIAALNGMLSKKKEDKDAMDKCNNIIQNEYLGKLKDAELEALKIEAEINEIEEDKVNLTNELLEFNREALAWEKKIQMVLETKQTLNEEKSGEMENMRMEIHRMEIRLGQLKKVQEKLIADLEHCVTRRDAIICGAEAREKKSQGSNIHSRANLTKKMEDLRNKIKHMNNEVKNIQEKMKAAVAEEDAIQKELTSAEEDVATIKQNTEKTKEDVELVKTDRQKNLELLVYRQKQAQLYIDMERGRDPFILYKTENAIKAEYDKQKLMNDKLTNIIENLLLDFPKHMHVLNRILNTLTTHLL